MESPRINWPGVFPRSCCGNRVQSGWTENWTIMGGKGMGRENNKVANEWASTWWRALLPPVGGDVTYNPNTDGEREIDLQASLFFFFFLIPGYNRASYVIFMFSGVTIYNFAVSQTTAVASHSFFIKQHFFGATPQQPPPINLRFIYFPPVWRAPLLPSDWYPDRKSSLHLCKHVSHTLAGKGKSRSLERYAVSENL